ncbi:MAG: hypothetical protein ABSA48_15510 [Terracidiphilus sp.]|jgi:hypothetical protein
MSGEQQKFDDLMKRVVKVSPEELRRRLNMSKVHKKNAKGETKGQTLDRT